jgi:hypothetical protein
MVMDPYVAPSARGGNEESCNCSVLHDYSSTTAYGHCCSNNIEPANLLYSRLEHPKQDSIIVLEIFKKKIRLRMRMKKCGVFILVCGLLSPFTVWGGQQTKLNGTSLDHELSSSVYVSSACKMSFNKSAFFSRKVSSSVRAFGAWRVHPHAVTSANFLSYASQMGKNKILRMVTFLMTCDFLFIKS